MNIPDFYAALEEIRRPELKKRVLVLAEPGDRSVIQGVNRIARGEGISEGMPVSHARRICRRMVAIPSDLYHYREKHRNITEEMGRFSPLVEGTWPGSYFLDITGTRRLWGPEPDIACRIEKELAGITGLHARIGLASNRLVSQVAASCIGPGDLGFIFPGNETSFLSPLPMTLLPGVGEVTASKLAGFNIRTIGQLASFPLKMLAAVFGKTADRLLKAAKSIRKSTIDAILAARTDNGPYQSLEDFLKRIVIHPSDAAVLVKSGTLDPISGGLNRPQILWFMEAWLNRVSATKNGKDQTQQMRVRAFNKLPPIAVPVLPDFSDRQKWAQEWETLRLILSVHPLDLAESFFRSVRQTIVPASNFAAHVGKKIWARGWPVTRKEVLTHEDEGMEFFTFEDKSSIFETVFFPRAFQRFCQDLDMNHAYLLLGEVQSEFGAVTLNVQHTQPDSRDGFVETRAGSLALDKGSAEILKKNSALWYR
ncbi:MAG: hypothetical protein WAW37_07110 [Syntrophobacteraceae bacterium]